MTAPATARLGEAFALGPAFRRFLELCGHEHAMAAVAHGASLEATIRALQSRGVPAKVVTLDTDDVPFVRAPALLSLKAGGFALLRDVGPVTCTLEVAGREEVTVAHRDVEAVVGSSAVEMGSVQRAGQGIVDRVVVALRAPGQLRRAAVHVLVLGLAMNLLGMSVPLITGEAMRDALPSGAGHTLGLLVVATLAVAVHQAILGVLRSRAARFLELKLDDLSLSHAFEALLGLPFARVHGTDAGELSASLSATELVAPTLLSGIALPVLDGVCSLGYVALLEGGVPGAGLVLVAVGVVAVLASVGAARALAAVDTGRIVASARQRTALYEVLSGMSTLRAAGAERRLGARWVGLLADELTASQASQLLVSIHGQIFETTTALLSAGLLFWGADRCLAGVMDVGVLVASLQSCMALWGAVVQLCRVPLAVVSLRALAARADMLAGDPPDRGDGGPPVRVSAEDAISVQGLWFRYAASEPWLFSGYDLRVARGEIVRLRWPSGHGKSTLLRLLAGLYRPAHGAISIFGEAAHLARDKVCYLPQTAVLFPGSVLDNLRRLSGGAPAGRIFAAAAVTGLDEVVRRWGMGFETCIIGGGSNLSSGQKQLVALTAAIASERPILLLDEATAHLDPVIRARLAASPVFADRTVITVVHDIEPGESSEASRGF